jgi:hypothetical protein
MSLLILPQSLVAAALSAVLLLAGLAKIVAPAPFQAALTRHGVFGVRSRRLLVRWLGPAEVLLALGLQVEGVFAPIAVASAGLFTGFAVYHLLLREEMRGRDCGCFSHIDLPIQVSTLPAAVVMAGLAAGQAVLFAAWGVRPYPPTSFLVISVGVAFSAAVLVIQFRNRAVRRRRERSYS